MVKKRKYESELRAKAAAMTRATILEAAGGLFLSKGYAATSIREIAKTAGVAEPTVYATFGDKAELFKAYADTWVWGVDDGTSLTAALEGVEDLEQRVRIGLRHLHSVWQRGDLRDVIDKAVAVDERLADLAAWADDHSYRNTRKIIELVLAGVVPAEHLDDLVDFLWAAFNSVAFRRLLGHRRWDYAKFEDWMTRLVIALVESR